MTGNTAKTFDVIVLGGGAGGMTAALVAAIQGLSVCLLEKESQIGGTTAWSGGQVWAPGNHVSKTMRDSVDDSKNVRAYLNGIIPGSEKDVRMAAFLETAPKAVNYLVQNSQVRLQPVPLYPDYYPDHPGATTYGRVLEPEPFNASVLGSKLNWLRLPLPEFVIFKDMMVARSDLAHFHRVFNSFASFFVVAKLVFRHSIEKYRYGRGTSLVLGNALVARFFASLLDADVTIETNKITRSLILGENGNVSGIEMVDGGCIGARFGVVLATGGFTHDADRRREHLPSTMSDYSATFPGATGDGARLAGAVGARFTPAVSGNAFLAPVSTYIRMDGSSAVFAHTVSDRAKPGLIAVNRRGERFVNEAVSYHEFGRSLLALQEEGSGVKATAWLIADASFVWKYGLGAVKPKSLNKKFFVSRGYLVTASSIAHLEKKLMLPSGALINTIQEYNRFSRKGDDPMFGRGSNAYQRFLGDQDVKPNPCVAPIWRPPFFAVKVEVGDLGAAAGLDTDYSSRVLDGDQKPIQGLYACGADARSVMEGCYPGPGITLGPAITFGYLAAMDIVARANRRSK